MSSQQASYTAHIADSELLSLISFCLPSQPSHHSTLASTRTHIYIPCIAPSSIMSSLPPNNSITTTTAATNSPDTDNVLDPTFLIDHTPSNGLLVPVHTLYTHVPDPPVQPLSSTANVPKYPTPDERLELLNQHYELMLNGPRIDLLSKLPYEIATYILNFVDMHNLAKVALISRTWNQFARDNEVWRSIFLYQKQWKIRVPQHRLLPSPGPVNMGAESKQVTQSSKPLNWKRLCYDRKHLEERWKGVPTKARLLGHADSVYCVQFDHSKIVTGSRDHTIKFWDLQTLTCIHTLRGHTQSVLCLQFNDKVVVSGSSDSTIIVWDIDTRQIIHRLHGHTAGVLDVCFDDQYIVSCSKDTTIKVWDFATRTIVRTMTGHRGPVNAVQLHKGQVVSASGDCVVKLWDVNTGQCIRDFIGHERGLACVQFDGTTIVSGSNDKKIRIWEAATGRCIRVLEGHTDLVRTLHFEQNKIVSGSYDHTVRVWDMTTGECLLNLQNGHSSWVFDVQFSSSRIIRYEFATNTSRSFVVLFFDSKRNALLKQVSLSVHHCYSFSFLSSTQQHLTGQKHHCMGLCG